MVNDQSARRCTVGNVVDVAAITVIRPIKVAQIAATTGGVVAATFTTLIIVAKLLERT
jgi:hypothetical protein